MNANLTTALNVSFAALCAGRSALAELTQMLGQWMESPSYGGTVLYFYGTPFRGGMVWGYGVSPCGNPHEPGEECIVVWGRQELEALLRASRL